MKHLFLLFTLFPLLSFAQTVNNFDLGLEVAPMLNTKDIRNLQQGSIVPNLTIAYGSKSLKAVVSLGNISRFGFVASNKWTYANGYYTVNTIGGSRVEHGAEIELGFNKRFGKNEEYRFYTGAAIGLLNTGKFTKTSLRPFVFGFVYSFVNLK
jgi:hypothetical protein